MLLIHREESPGIYIDTYVYPGGMLPDSPLYHHQE